MALWVDVYDHIQFQVDAYGEQWAIWRIRFLGERVVYRTVVYSGIDKEKLEKNAITMQKMHASFNSFYR